MTSLSDNEAMNEFRQHLPDIISVLVILAVIGPAGGTFISGVPLLVQITLLIIYIPVIVGLFRVRRELAESFRIVLETPPPADARLAVATIREVTPTGLLLRGVRCHVVDTEVHRPDGIEFPCRLRLFIPEKERAHYQPGVMVPVVYPPRRPTRCHPAPAEWSHESWKALDMEYARKGLADPGLRGVRDHGVAVPGVVVSATPTGHARHAHSQMDITVRFPLPDGTIVERSRTTWVSPLQLPQLIVGAPVDVRYLPHDDAKFVLQLDLPEWSGKRMVSIDVDLQRLPTPPRLRAGGSR